MTGLNHGILQINKIATAVFTTIASWWLFLTEKVSIKVFCPMKYQKKKSIFWGPWPGSFFAVYDICRSLLNFVELSWSILTTAQDDGY